MVGVIGWGKLVGCNKVEEIVLIKMCGYGVVGFIWGLEIGWFKFVIREEGEVLEVLRVLY